MNFNTHAQNSTIVENLNFGSNGGHLMVAIPVQPGQHWFMASNAGWIHVIGKRAGVGPDVVIFDVQPNLRRTSRDGSLLDAPNVSFEPDFGGRSCVDPTYTRPKFRFEIHQAAALG